MRHMFTRIRNYFHKHCRGCGHLKSDHGLDSDNRRVCCVWMANHQLCFCGRD